MVDVETHKNILYYLFGDSLPIELRVAQQEFVFRQESIEVAIEIAENTLETRFVAFCRQKIVYVIESGNG